MKYSYNIFITKSTSLFCEWVQWWLTCLDFSPYFTHRTYLLYNIMVAGRGQVLNPSIRNHMYPIPNWKQHVGMPNKTEYKTLHRGTVTCHLSITQTLRIIKNWMGSRKSPAYNLFQIGNYGEQNISTFDRPYPWNFRNIFKLSNRHWIPG